MQNEKLDKKTWIALRPQLNNQFSYNPIWEKVIYLFKKRIDDFYISPIESILKPQSKKGEGFTIVTLQCALIETFAAFKLGKIYNHRKKPSDPNYEYSKSGDLFVNFLLTEDIFENHFFTINAVGIKRNHYPFNAKDFYERVRCALMHESRTKDDWRITANPKKTGANMFIGNDGTDKVIHRTILHKKIKGYFENNYLMTLRLPNALGNKMRRFLGRKLDHLHSLKRDTSYDWWIDK